jgi:Uma2 family endonuclease
VTTQTPGTVARWTAPEGAWTEPDLHLFPQDGHRYEILDGGLHVSPPPPEPHETLVRAVVSTLRAAAPEGWWACDRLGIATAGSNLVPDVAVLRPRSSGATWCDPADVALVVEVESPATRRYDRLLKPAVYAAAGIPSLWLVEPGQARVFALVEGRYEVVHEVGGTEPVKLDAPYPIRIAPADWLS